jgi:hypothetical protein
LYIGLNAFVALNQLATGIAAQRIVQALRERTLIECTDPGAIEVHVGNEFPAPSDSPRRYVVVNGIATSALVSVRSNPFPGVYKTYSVISSVSITEPKNVSAIH